MRIVKTRDHDLNARVLDYAVRIVILCRALPKTEEARLLRGQLFRAGTSVGAHIAEANHAKSRADFVSKLEGGLQELEETKFWITLLIRLGMVPSDRLDPLVQETNEITAILTAMVSRSRERK